MEERKHTGKIVGIFVLMFMSLYGQKLEELIQNGMDYDEAGAYGFLLSFASLCFISLVMMIVPFATRLAYKEKLPYKRGKRICIWNSIILFLISSILLGITETSFIGGVGALAFYFINKWIFISGLKEPMNNSSHNTYPTPSIPNRPVQSTYVCLSEENETPRKYGTYSAPISDVRLEQGTELDFQTKMNPEKVKTTVSTCSMESRSRGVTLKVLVNIVVLTVLLVSFVANIVLCVKNAELKKMVTNLTEVNEQYYSYWLDNLEKMEFYDEYIVFVEDDNTNFYHKYDCYRFVGESFWAYNVEAAIVEGYVACPHCCY